MQFSNSIYTFYLQICILFAVLYPHDDPKGQLGHKRKIFVNAPARSEILSSSSSSITSESELPSPLDGVIAVGNCSASHRNGRIVSMSGSCAKVISKLHSAVAAEVAHAATKQRPGAS